MNNYKRHFKSEFLKDLKKIKSNFEIKKRLDKKIKEILENPYHYKPLRNVFKNKRRTHIGSFVLIFEIDEQNKLITFHSFQHHDNAYKK